MHKFTLVGLAWINVKNMNDLKAIYTLEIDGNKSEGEVLLDEIEIRMFDRLALRIEKRMAERLEDAIRKAQLG